PHRSSAAWRSAICTSATCRWKPSTSGSTRPSTGGRTWFPAPEPAAGSRLRPRCKPAKGNKPMVKIGILGAAGRMGQMIGRETFSGQHAGAALGAAVDHVGSWALGRDFREMLGFGPGEVSVTGDKDAAFAVCDVMIDFTVPEAAVEHAGLAHQHGRALVIGTTGLAKTEEAAIDSAAARAPVLQAANMSVGVNVLASIVEQVSRL